MARKKWTSEEKHRIVMEVLTTRAPLSEICSRYNVQPSMVYKWKQDFIDGGSRARYAWEEPADNDIITMACEANI